MKKLSEKRILSNEDNQIGTQELNFKQLQEFIFVSTEKK